MQKNKTEKETKRNKKTDGNQERKNEERMKRKK